MKDILYVEHPYFVTAKEDSVKFKNIRDKSLKYFLFSEIEAIIFDYSNCYLSQSLVIKCIEHKIPIIFCDEKHSPLTEINMNFRSKVRLNRISLQLQMLSKTKDRIWKKVVMKKILNQAKCLENNLVFSSKVKELTAIAKEVSPGDRNNREALAARIYFQSLYGNKFKRGRYDDLTNAGLNYGYAIIRAFIKNELAYHGFEMSMGIKHYSMENPFNLSDDIIEAYRPFVDNRVYEIVNDKKTEYFGSEEKKKLLEVIHDKCIIDNKVVHLLDSIKITVQSLIQCYEKNSPTPLKLPQMIGVES
ncbi:CRISPR-associated protein Cas1 [Staphylococcus microti]|uniref:CRISPR-associated protein Cas1 n=1 Tax=Staphylococcus microti TaxID=569857 RepID=A0A0D6XRX8_9STAP|nr:type II CRISPR-associated endonuclease Cas1 [Staphylococcus microti]KIX91205.1 CRISPR-associated protein Cas1 [Staphylococcus microti]PNZ79926.1 type II CRISPR-associated endonuclease Cas1 [Staphylococcus microti]SUM56456.1 Cas1 family protein [Staphylococcus microti]